ncbi:SAM-dependent methyltransferase [Enterobacillus tribolii]|uniref:tRNA-Thr(GGU) m(6)t(6)A37 methyltransferase TsaA n=1 Tax=Enterobacillus tribolii TaxID=1487935 RepID=A0A370R3U8_9GAMM|nr:SAM-dependent methyltransferase [Enterobacillus tribolii]MBW7984735.1 S-adenosylmethionine-dependent methyltransferase [Enterobacillus tribolii]RDK96735.1 tRNA-Thr(GGU) m(6)t(6)A37 methyltransferase TsaA [Enterobacillus tribolii]
MKTLNITPIGTVEIVGDETCVILEKMYIPALKGLEGFSHINILWWFDRSDTAQLRRTRVSSVPYRDAGEMMGVFATRSPQRPNPLALTVARILHIDPHSGRVWIDYIDADQASPVIDLKPYTPSLDRVENPGVPPWCAGWPNSLEASADYDWEKVFGPN